MKHLIITLIIILPFFPFSPALSQRDLQTDSVFKAYGMMNESVLVTLSTDVLSKNSNISFYKSLVMPENTERALACARALEKDMKGGTKLFESQKNGKLETAYYVLKLDSKNKTYEYLLYKNKSKKLTLVYLKGDFPPQQLEQELDKLKDLFIYVNKKRIKLNN